MRAAPRAASACLPDRVAARRVKAAGLPATARLRSRADFAHVNRSRTTLTGRYFRLRHAAGQQAWPRLGLAVSRKVSKRAVERNRLKRVARTSFRLHRAQLPARDLLLIARPEAAAVDNAGLRQDLEGLWARLAALKSAPADGTIAD